MWIVVESQKLKESPDETEIAKAELRMKECLERIETLTKVSEKIN